MGAPVTDIAAYKNSKIVGQSQAVKKSEASLASNFLLAGPGGPPSDELGISLGLLVADFISYDTSKGVASLRVEIERGPTYHSLVAITEYLVADQPVMDGAELMGGPGNQLAPFRLETFATGLDACLDRMRRALGDQAWCLERPAAQPLEARVRMVAASPARLRDLLDGFRAEFRLTPLPGETIGEETGFLALYPSGIVRSVCLNLDGGASASLIDPSALIDPAAPAGDGVDIECAVVILAVNPVGRG